MGEAKRRQLAVQTQALEAMVVDTPGGRIHVKWDHGASATPNAQLTFFSEFLATTGSAGRAVGKIRAESATSTFLHDFLMFGMAKRHFGGSPTRPQRHPPTSTGPRPLSAAGSSWTPSVP
eukprot:gene15397-32578_t